jgi:hypothetical protein
MYVGVAYNGTSNLRSESNRFECIGCSFKFPFKVCVEESIIVNAPWVTDQLFESSLTFCVVFVFTLQTDEWCDHNRLFNANFEEIFIFVNVILSYVTTYSKSQATTKPVSF